MIRGLCAKGPKNGGAQAFSALSRQVDCVTSGRDHRIILEKWRRIPSAQLLKPRHQKRVTNLLPGPANFFNTLAPSPPLRAFPDEQVDIAPRPVCHRVMTAAHDYDGVALFKAHGSRPILAKANLRINAEEEISA